MISGVVESMVSGDGTAIGCEVTGSGPALVVVHGTLRAARHYRAMAAALADDFTVYTMDRRGRGASGPQGAGYDIDTECDDLAAVLAHTGATMVFGHSFGGLVGLELARRRATPITRLAVYEPAVSIGGAYSGSWLPELDSAVADDRIEDGVISVMRGLELLGPFTQLPTRLQRAMAKVIMRRDVMDDMRALLPTVHAEVVTAIGLDSDGDRYADVTVDTLLITGERGPSYLRGVAEVLDRVMPRSAHRVLPRCAHNAPELDAPETIAAELRRYFTG
ncbi:MAG TPA: alpha/beta hydrolase [Pseudonocardiaceae bacterium]|nr:alpha/beta hydrolase [Pseudonocardiaceae bacterium]